MPTDLQQFIDDATVIDTHEHMRPEDQWVHEGPNDVLQSLSNQL